MLKVTDAQLESIDAQVIAAFHDRVCGFLRQIAASDVAAMDDAALLAFVESGDRAARSFGVLTERGVVLWLCLGIMIGPEFAELPAIASLLEQSQSPDRAMNELFERLALIETRHGAR